MLDQDVMLQKISQIQNCLKRIQDTIAGRPELLDEYDSQDIFVLNLQRAVQSSIDLAAHIVADEGLGLPGELKENFELLYKAKIIGKSLSDKLKKMVGFRNIAVHEYDALDSNILKSIYQHHLRDLEDFYRVLLEKFSNQK